MEKLKYLRKLHKISQKQLADKIGYSQSVLCDWENGKSEPTATPIRKLAQFFNVTTDYLLDIETEDGRKIYNQTYIGVNHVENK